MRNSGYRDVIPIPTLELRPYMKPRGSVADLDALLYFDRKLKPYPSDYFDSFLVDKMDHAVLYQRSTTIFPDYM